jgi:hypothetical protein
MESTLDSCSRGCVLLLAGRPRFHVASIDPVSIECFLFWKKYLENQKPVYTLQPVAKLRAATK